MEETKVAQDSQVARDSQPNAADLLMENMRLMNQIVGEMKEIPILPSEVVKPNDTQALIKVEFPNAGGVLTYMEGHEYPYKGFPYFEFVDRIDLMKKLTRSQLSGLYHALKKRNKLQLALLFLVPWFFKDFLRAQLYTYYRLIERFRVKPIRHCDAVRELHHSFGASDEPDLKRQLRDTLSMVLEFDNAYRFRFQDVVVELDKDTLRRRPVKELRRLIGILSARERSQEIRDTWTLVSLFTRFYLPFDRELRELLRDALLRLDLEQVKLLPGDQHYCEGRKDYLFGFQETVKQENLWPTSPTCESKTSGGP